jgi:hypothetical protein
LIDRRLFAEMATTSEPTVAISASLQQPSIDCYFNQHDQQYVGSDNDHGSHNHVTASGDDALTQVTSNRSDEVEGGDEPVPEGPLQINGKLNGSKHGENMNGTGDDSNEADNSTATDADGFRVEHRYETESVSRSKEVRDLSDDCTELRLRETKEVTLEELKTKDVETRPATFEELRALLEAQFDGKDEVEIAREVVVDEFTRVESQREEVKLSVFNIYSCQMLAAKSFYFRV